MSLLNYLKQANISCENFTYHSELKTWVFTEFLLDYELSLKIQDVAQLFVKENNQESVFIFCSHPPLFTLGKGLQKGPTMAQENLIDWNPDSKLPYPLYTIKRGGGLTFHYPGQWIMYVITKLNSSQKTLSHILNFILKSTQSTIQELYALSTISAHRDLMGIWFKEKKIASLGMATSRFVTSHGLALNLQSLDIYKRELTSLHPCGLPFTTYTSVEDLLNKSVDLKKFHASYVENFLKTLPF